MSRSSEHFLFSHQALSWQLSELHPPHLSFSEHRQQARPHRAIPNSLFINDPSIKLSIYYFLYLLSISFIYLINTFLFLFHVILYHKFLYKVHYFHIAIVLYTVEQFHTKPHFQDLCKAHKTLEMLF